MANNGKKIRAPRHVSNISVIELPQKITGFSTKSNNITGSFKMNADHSIHISQGKNEKSVNQNETFDITNESRSFREAKRSSYQTATNVNVVNLKSVGVQEGNPILRRGSLHSISFDYPTSHIVSPKMTEKENKQEKQVKVINIDKPPFEQHKLINNSA